MSENNDLDNMKDKAKDIVEDIKEKSGDAKEKIVDAVDDAKDSVSDTVDEAKEFIERKSSETEKQSEQKAKELEDKAKELASETKENAKEVKENVKNATLGKVDEIDGLDSNTKKWDKSENTKTSPTTEPSNNSTNKNAGPNPKKRDDDSRDDRAVKFFKYGFGMGIIVGASIMFAMLPIINNAKAPGDSEHAFAASSETAVVDNDSTSAPVAPNAGGTPVELDFRAVQVEGTPLPGVNPSWPGIENGGKSPLAGIEAPRINMEGMDGEDVLIGKGAGKAQAVALLAHWCPYCNNELPQIDGWAKGKDADRFEVVVVTSDNSPEQPNYPPTDWIKKSTFKGKAAVDANNVVANNLGLQAFPTWIFLDDKGVVVSRHEGPISQELFDEYYQLALDGYKGELKDNPLDSLPGSEAPGGVDGNGGTVGGDVPSETSETSEASDPVEPVGQK